MESQDSGTYKFIR